MFDVSTALPAKRKRTASGWISFNAPCCVHKGENPDRRQRGGIKPNPDGSWSYHCFNCGYTASFIVGRNLSFKARKLLQWLSVPPEEIERINLESLRHRNIEGILHERRQVSDVLQGIDFEERDLPARAELMTDQHPEYQAYIRSRGLSLNYPYMVQLNTELHFRPHIIIPFTHNNKIVGWAKRFIDNTSKLPKYINDTQPGYVFGTDLQQPNWNHVLVMEGVFDALSINGLAVLHADINDAQARLIRSLDRSVTVVPDQDTAGMKLVDRALELGWAVSIPEWPDTVKDVNDAVIRFGKLGALLTIMQARETSRIKIQMRRKQLAKRLHS